VPSTRRTGSLLDNTLAESFVATLKTEFVHRYCFRPLDTKLEFHRGLLKHARSHSALLEYARIQLL
jgi:transposase InsO family protein